MGSFHCSSINIITYNVSIVFVSYVSVSFVHSCYHALTIQSGAPMKSCRSLVRSAEVENTQKCRKNLYHCHQSLIQKQNVYYSFRLSKIIPIFFLIIIVSFCITSMTCHKLFRNNVDRKYLLLF